MSSFDYSSVWLCRLVVLILTLCVGSDVSLGQRLRISDGDVSFSERGKEEREHGRPGVTESSRNASKQRLLAQLKVDTRREAEAVRLAIYKEAARYNIDPNLVVAIVWQESRFRSDAVSEKNARGLMQLMPETAARFNVRDPHDPQESIR